MKPVEVRQRYFEVFNDTLVDQGKKGGLPDSPNFWQDGTKKTPVIKSLEETYGAVFRKVDYFFDVNIQEALDDIKEKMVDFFRLDVPRSEINRFLRFMRNPTVISYPHGRPKVHDIKVRDALAFTWIYFREDDNAQLQGELVIGLNRRTYQRALRFDKRFWLIERDASDFLDVRERVHQNRKNMIRESLVHELLHHFFVGVPDAIGWGNLHLVSDDIEKTIETFTRAILYKDN